MLVGVSEIQMLVMFYLVVDNEMLKRIVNLKPLTFSFIVLVSSGESLISHCQQVFNFHTNYPVLQLTNLIQVMKIE
jgi:hypothetical protein